MQIILWLLAGWPAIIACMIITIIGLFKKDYRLLLVAGVLAIPFCWILSGFPSIRSFMFFSPLLLFTAAWTMFHKWDWVAWLFAIPFLLTILLFLSVVLNTPA